MGSKGHIITDLGQSGFGFSCAVPVLHTEAPSLPLELILRPGRHHRTHLVMKDLLRLANRDHFPVHVTDLVDGLKVLVTAFFRPLELGTCDGGVHFIFVFSGPPCFCPLFDVRQAFTSSFSVVFLPL